jgi:hypothetical protein
MKRLRCATSSLALVSAALWLPIASAHAQQPDAIDQIYRSPIPGLNQSPHSALSTEQRQANGKKVIGFCALSCIMNYGAISSHEPSDLATAEMTLCSDACFVGHLSQDFPHYADLKAKALADLARAKMLGSPTTLTIPP